jgi:hypothetical protein
MGTFTNKVVGIFNNRMEVDSLLTDLNEMGYQSKDISVLAKDHDPARVIEYERTSIINTSDNDVTRIKVSSTVKQALTEDNNYEAYHEVVDKDPGAMLKTATTGGAIGLLAGLGLLLIPGIGPVLAAGPLLAVLTAGAAGAAVGATTGTLIGLLKDEGIPVDRAEFYNNHFNNGGVLVVVNSENDKKYSLREVFSKHHANTIDSF